MALFEVQQAFNPAATFYSLGVQGRTLDELWNHLENNLFAWHHAMTGYAIPIEFGCTCPSAKEGPQVAWAYAKDLDGSIAQPLHINYAEMAQHITGTADATHVVTLTPSLHLRTVELDA